MNETTHEDENPFGMELAYRVYQNNMKIADDIVESLPDQAEKGTNEEKLLLMATEAIGRLTDNTVLKSIVENSLKEREHSR